MSNTITPSDKTDNLSFLKRIQFIFFIPGSFFSEAPITNQKLWIGPLIILTITLFGNVIVTGWVKQQNSVISEESLPPDFQYYSPEQQTQYLQAKQITQGPIFIYTLPAIAKILGLWITLLAIGGLLHLTTTLFGGRGDMTISLNIVAWASLPFALRDIVRGSAMLISRQLINHPGLSGFAPATESGWGILLGQILGLIDIYLVWQLCLVIFGIRLTSNLPTKKALVSGLISILCVLIFRGFIGVIIYQLGGLTVIRPFFF